MTMNYSRFTEKNIRTAWLKKWGSEFLEGLEGLSGKEAIQSYCIAKKAEYEQEIKDRSGERLETENRINSGVGWMNSASTNMSQIRNAIKAWQDYKAEKGEMPESDTYPQTTKEGIIQQHLSLLFMNYPREFHIARQEPTKDRKNEQRSNLEPITCIDEYQATIDKLLQSTDYRELTAGLIAATGRRPSEILVTAEFKQINQFEVEFTGQIKNRGEDRASYDTYTLVESYKVLDALARLRRIPEIAELKEDTLAEVDSGKNNKMNSKVKEFFSDLLKPPMGEIELSAKNLRASYAAIAIYLFCPWEKSTNQFITEKLGHIGDGSATNYEDYQVCDKEGRPLTRGAWIARLNEEITKSTEGNIISMELRLSEAAKNTIDNIDFLPFADSVSRIDELIRLARIGKRFEEGELLKEVLIVQSEPHVKTSEPQIAESEIAESEIAVRERKVKDVSELTNTELLGSNIPYSGLEKIRRAVDAIKIYNERQTDAKFQWAINTKSLKDLTGSRTEAVQNYLNATEGRLNVYDYNLEKGYSYQHNRGKGSIKDFIKLV